MSSFLRNTKHPKTGKVETARWHDDHFGPHRYGVEFEDGTIVDPEKTKLDTNEGKTEKDWNWNPWPKEGEEPPEPPVDPDELIGRLSKMSQDIQASNDELTQMDRDFGKWKKGRAEISDGLRLAYQDVVALKSRHLTVDERTIVLTALLKAKKGGFKPEGLETVIKKLSGSDIMLGSSLKE